MPDPKPTQTKELIVFDLDGTLAPSKSPIDDEMAQLFSELLKKKKVAVISGGAFPRFEVQLLQRLPPGQEGFDNLFIMPTSGTRMYVWRGTWAEQYAEHLEPKEKERIMTAFNEAFTQTGYVSPPKVYGKLLEDRGSQITFSGLGMDAPREITLDWDPDRAKRSKIVAVLEKKLPQFDVRMGGSTSIDVTKRGVNKAYGIRKLEQRLNMHPESIAFVGDALFPGGNDYPARATGVDCFQVKGPEDTKNLIRKWIA